MVLLESPPIGLGFLEEIITGAEDAAPVAVQVEMDTEDAAPVAVEVAHWFYGVPWRGGQILLLSPAPSNVGQPQPSGHPTPPISGYFRPQNVDEPCGSG